MILFKKNIWLLFYLIAFIGAMIFGIAIYQKYNDTLNEAKKEQLYLTKLYQNRFNAIFGKHETLQNLIAREYQRDPYFEVETFATVLRLNPLLLDIWLFSKEGDLKLSTFPEFPFLNQLQNKKTRKWFQEALSSDQMIIGQTYLHKNMNKWILPMHKRISGKNGETIAVISSGIDLAMLLTRWNKEISSANTIEAILANSEFGLLRTGLKTDQYGAYYNSALSQKDISQLNSQQLEIKDLNTYLQHDDDINGQKILHTIGYNKHYKLWVSTKISYSLIFQNIYKYWAFCFAFYMLIMICIFLLFRWVNQIEKSKYSAMTYKAEHDTLTGLPNKTLLKKQFYKLQKNAETPFALLYLDLDNFKNINDIFGHSYGDKILIELSNRLSIQSGVVARYSGDEFIIFVESGNKEEIAIYSEALLMSIALPFLIAHNAFKITGSIGIACFPDDTKNIETLLSYADSSLFMAKKRKNNFLFFSKEIYHKRIRNTEVEQALHSAVANKEISLVYQPQLNSKKELLGVEALVRWNNKKLGFVGPDVFIPIAENAGLMPELGLYIMHKAMLEVATLKEQTGFEFTLSINVSAKQFMQPNFIKKLRQACIYYAIDKTSIIIEITESLFIENLDTLLPIFNQMKSYGISLSLDDFGTGYSSLSMLKKVPFDELKIDKSFVDFITENQTDKEMVKSIIAMGKNLGLSVLAEGVETQEQVEILQQANCDIFQGYYFSKPISIHELESFARKHKKAKVKQGLLCQAL